MMGSPDGGAPSPPMTFFRPRESERGVYTEKKFGDESTGIWETAELPADAVVTHVTCVPYRRERPVMAWRAGDLRLPEGDVAEGESGDAAVRRVLLEQTGIKDPQIKHLGHFKVTSGARSTQRPAGSITYDVLYGIEVKDFEDPGDQSFERRIVEQRDLNILLREGHVERRLEYAHTLDAWLIERLKASAKS